MPVPSRPCSLLPALLAGAMAALGLAACATPDDDAGFHSATIVAAGDGAAAALAAAADVPEGGVIVAAPAAEAGEQVDDAIAAADDNADAGPDAAPPKVGDEISRALTEGMPLEVNADIEHWIEYFTGKDRERFQRFLERGEKYKAQVAAVLKDQGIPSEIYYQAMIESGFVCGATSRASAAGIWQFMKNTGRRYGLRVDGYVDERRDPMRATIAAALYLKDLHNVFQSWYLAMAAYNAGEGRIMGAIMRSKTRDFWEMVRKHELPAETMSYIPKFLAATIIGLNPRRYGFDELHPGLVPPLVSVEVPSPVRLSDVARVAGIPLDALRDYNQHLLRGITPPGVATYRIWVPQDQAAAVGAQTEALAALRLRSVRPAAATADAPLPRYHTVAAGDTLVKVARLYGIPVAQLKRLNHLRGARLAPGTRLTLRKGEAGAPAATAAAASFRHYKVKRGDSLEAIARRFGVSVQELMMLNRLKRHSVYAGETLKVGNLKG